MKKFFLHLDLKNIVIFVFILILSVQYGLQYTNYELGTVNERILLIPYMALFLYFIFTRNYNLRELAIFTVLIIIGVVVVFKTHFTGFLLMVITPIVISTWDWKSVFKSFFYIRSIIFISIIMLSLMGVLNLYKTVVIKGNYSTIGYGLGFSHPNRLAYGFVYLLFTYIAFVGKSFNKKDYICITFGLIVCYAITQSRTAILCVVSILLLVTLVKSRFLNKNIKRLVAFLGYVCPPLCVFISIGVPQLMLSSNHNLRILADLIDKLFSGRFKLISRTFKYYDMTLFGGVNSFDILDRIYKYSTVDNGYIRFLYAYGIVGLFVYIVLTLLTVNALSKHGNYLFVSLIIVTSLWGISENVLMSVGFNITVLFWSVLLRRTSTNEKMISTCSLS